MRGALKNAPVIGLPILSGLKKDGAEYTGRRIIDPDNGKVYSSKIQLTNGGKKLNVARLHWRVNAGSFADLGAPGIISQARQENYLMQSLLDDAHGNTKHDSIRSTRHSTFHTGRCNHRWGRPGHQLKLRQAVRGKRHACRHRSQESGQIGPAESG